MSGTVREVDPATAEVTLELVEHRVKGEAADGDGPGGIVCCRGHAVIVLG